MDTQYTVPKCACHHQQILYDHVDHTHFTFACTKKPPKNRSIDSIIF